MFKLESIASFVSVVETGSVAGAARRLGVSKSVVSERLTELERVLGTKLIRRTTRRAGRLIRPARRASACRLARKW